MSKLNNGLTLASFFRPPWVTDRDKRTLEIRSAYGLPIEPGTHASYVFNAYIFFPRSFSINAQTWSRDVFYRYAQTLLRLHAPTLTLEALGDASHPSNPLALLRQNLSGLTGENPPSAASLCALVQLFGAELTDVLARDARLIQEQLRLASDPAVAESCYAEIDALCEHGLRALRVLRKMQVASQAYMGVTPPKLLDLLAFASEYASAVFDECLSEIALSFDESPITRDGSAKVARLRVSIARTIEQLNVERREQGFASAAGEEPEYYAYRQGLLKKELQRALYINARAAGRDPFYANSAAMVAAGIAATWATLAQIPMLNGQLSTSNRLLFIGTAVGAYITKDRIKDWVKSHLSKRWLQWDHDNRIDGGALAELGLASVAGRARERMRWLDEKSVPDRVQDLRRALRTVRGVGNELEHVLHYSRELAFESPGPAVIPTEHGVLEIFRLSLDDIVRRLDEAQDTVSFYDDRKGLFTRAALPKVYHLNVVTTAHDVAAGREVLSRTRVVLNRKGIVRIEPVATESRANTAGAPEGLTRKIKMQPMMLKWGSRY